MKLILLLLLLISFCALFAGCKFCMKEFSSHVGEIQAITKGFEK